MRYLAIEAGATHSLAGLYSPDGALLAQAEGGPCNPTAYGWDASIRVLAELGEALLGLERHDVVVLAGMAGACNAKARTEAAQRLCIALRVPEARVAEDLYPILFANAGNVPALLAIGGTGSNAVGCTPGGRWAQVGGRGHVFGDEGSAYAIGVAALRAVAQAEDGMAPATSLTQALVQATGGTETSDLIAWAGAAGKRDVAQLTRAVVEQADEGDAVAAGCINEQAARLAAQVIALAHKLELTKPATVYGHGGLFENCPRYVAAFTAALAAQPSLTLGVPHAKGPEAVLALARVTESTHWLTVLKHARATSATLSPTETGNASARTIDELTPQEIVDAMTAAGVEAAQAVAHAAAALAPLVQAGAEALGRGGRIIYVGAGTSGRLGVLDASECPPTFGVDPSRVHGIIAGGMDALVRSIEGAEDDPAAGALAMDEASACADDLVIGIAASGNTPYVAGALERAAARGAATALITSNPAATTPAQFRVALDTGGLCVPGAHGRHEAGKP